MSLSIGIDRSDYVAGSYLFWTEHHSGQYSEGYARLSRYHFRPGLLFGWRSLTDDAREVYRAWCRRERETCQYDTVANHLDEDEWDRNDACVEYLLNRYGDELLSETSLVSYEQSDFVNQDMSYYRDLFDFYSKNEDEILEWVDKACEERGYTSRLELVEGDLLETPSDYAFALINAGMTYLARAMLYAARREAEDRK